MEELTIIGYYKGFHVDIPHTVTPVALAQAKRTVDGLINAGFVPSWNAETNKEVLPLHAPSQPQASQTVKAYEERCEFCGAKKILSSKGNLYCEDKCWLREVK